MWTDSIGLVYPNKAVFLQDAQLSQRDRAAACIIVLAKSKK